MKNKMQNEHIKNKTCQLKNSEFTHIDTSINMLHYYMLFTRFISAI